jgi:acetyl esterase
MIVLVRQYKNEHGPSTGPAGREAEGGNRTEALTGTGPVGCADRMAGAAAVDVTDLTILGRHGDIPARGYRGAAPGAGAALIWAHGGGFIGGDLDMPEAHWVAVELARRGIPVLSIDYTKCIEGVHHPIPSDDVLDAWLFVARHEEEFGVAPGHLHFGGASAGAHLVAGAAKRLRDGAGPLPTSLVLAYPNLHPVLPPPSEELEAALSEGRLEFVFTPAIMRDINLNYAGSEEVLDDVYAYPGIGDVSGLPPVFILNSERDSLRSSGEMFGEQLAAAGVPVRVEFEPGTVHGHLNQPDDPAAVHSLQRMAAWLAEW